MNSKAFRGFIVLSAILPVLNGCGWLNSKEPTTDEERIARLVEMDHGAIPVAYFFRNPDQTAYQISPDGRFISYLGPYQSRLNIYIQHTGQQDTVRLTAATERDITSYFWKNESTLIYLQDNAGDENYRIYSVDTSGTEKVLAEFRNVRINVVDELQQNPSEILISMNKSNPALFEPYRLDINSGEITRLAENKDIQNPVTSWVADNRGILRAAVSVEEGTTTHLLYREQEDMPFRSLISSNWKDMITPLFFDADNTHIIALSNLDRDKTALIRLDPDKPDQQEILYSNEEVDVWWAEQSVRTGGVASIYYITDRKYTIYPDTILHQVAEQVTKLLPGKEIYISSYDNTMSHFIVRTYADVSPGNFYLYTRSNGQLDHLSSVNPELAAYHLSPMKPVSYTTRDGLTVSAYLTLPATGTDKHIPVVMMVHGGPMSRDVWGYRPEVQLLASRGYAVMQVNFRGSWGFGKRFTEAGFREWGRKMQDDVSDGVQWLIDNGIADPDKVAIYGASYGGYAALAGLTFTPDLYACGISYVGPSNLFTLLDNLPAYWEPEKEMMYETIGHPKQDSSLLCKVSPVFHVSSITAPLFIAQGANDVRVTKVESEQMVEALRSKGVDVVYMLKEDEGHGFRLEENRLEFYQALCGFLETYMPASPPDKP